MRRILKRSRVNRRREPVEITTLKRSREGSLDDAGSYVCNSKVAHLAILIQQGMSQAHFLVFILMVISVPDETTQIIKEEVIR